MSASPNVEQPRRALFAGVLEMNRPYAAPTRLAPDLARVRAYWKGLLRGGAQMPFWDDAKLTDLPELADRLLLIDVFERPERFRFRDTGDALHSQDLTGRFIDEIELSWPFEFLRSQCSATVESATPTYFRHEGGKQSPSMGDYSRLLLPMWGEGRIGMLLGAVTFG